MIWQVNNASDVEILTVKSFENVIFNSQFSRRDVVPWTCTALRAKRISFPSAGTFRSLGKVNS